MKTKIVIALLAVVSIGLGIAFVVTKNRGEEQHRSDRASIDELTRQVGDVTKTNIEINEVNLQLNQALTNTQGQIAELSNSLVTAAVTLAESRTALANAQDQITNLNTHITDLEQLNRALDQHAAELTNTIAQLNGQITETQARLAKSETNNAYLQQALQRQMAEKAEIEHKFNDLNALRQQVQTIKTDMYVARRLQLMKSDISGKKGAELLMTRRPPPASENPQPNYGLNVEIGSDGSVHVIPPMGATNTAAH